MTSKTLTMIDLFCGSGGVTQGFKNAGFRVLAAIEIDPVVASSYRGNHPEVRLYAEDIRRVDPKLVLRQCRIKAGSLTVLSVCAPCQPFSTHNRSGILDNRTRLLLQTIRFAEAFRPEFVFVENVPGLLKGKNKQILDVLIRRLKNLGYKLTTPTTVDAADYGVPQHRERVILLGSRHRSVTMPETTHTSPTWALQLGKLVWRTVQEAFYGLSLLEAGENSESDVLHRARNHSSLNLQRLKYIPKDGGNRHSLPEDLQLRCHANSNGYNDVYGRMYLNRPSNTLTSGCTNFTRGRFAHPIIDRAITPREAARLQTFPDTYCFLGSYDQISTQIGNAVPVLLAESFGRHLALMWQTYMERR